MNGVRLLVPRVIVPHFIARRFDPASSDVLRRFLRPGMVVIDVGAHIGYYTALAAARVVPGGRVFAVEPAEENLAVLRRNVGRLAAGSVTVCECAAGPRRAVRTLHLTGSSDGHSFFPHPLFGSVGTVEVRQEPVDALVDGRVDLIKIDVEGAELDALAGMERILTENPQARLLVEWNPACMHQAGREPDELPELLLRRGYRLALLDEAADGPRSLDEARIAAAAGTLPLSWFANLWAEREP